MTTIALVDVGRYFDLARTRTSKWTWTQDDRMLSNQAGVSPAFYVQDLPAGVPGYVTGAWRDFVPDESQVPASMQATHRSDDILQKWSVAS